MKAKIGNLNINYEFLPRGNAPTVILSHSLGTDFRMWEPQMKALTSRFSVLRYDTRGHGQSEAVDGDYTFEQLKDDAIGLADFLGVEKFHWVGLSMGGMIGQSIAFNHPERLESLVLCDTAASMPDEAQPKWQERINTAKEKGLQGVVDSTLEDWFTKELLERRPQSIRQVIDQFLKTSLQGYVGCIGAIRKLNHMDSLSSIKCPTLIIVGEQDFGTPVEASLAMRERIPESQLAVIPSAAHISNVEQPEKFQEKLMNFLLSVVQF